MGPDRKFPSAGAEAPAPLASWDRPTLLSLFLGETDGPEVEDAGTQALELSREDYLRLAEVYPEDPFVLEALSRVQQRLGLTGEWTETLSRAAANYRALGKSGAL
jgi:hypothetical protein